MFFSLKCFLCYVVPTLDLIYLLFLVFSTVFNCMLACRCNLNLNCCFLESDGTV